MFVDGKRQAILVPLPGDNQAVELRSTPVGGVFYRVLGRELSGT